MSVTIVKPAADSKTLQFNRLATIVATIVAAAPTVISFIVDLFADPQIGAAIAGFIPVQYRALVVLIVMFIAKRNSDLRRQTTTPIQGTPAAEAFAESVRNIGLTAEQIAERVTQPASSGNAALQQFLTGGERKG